MIASNNKKAQLHITETIAVLFIFFILVAFGLIFYARYQQTAVQEKQEQLLASRAMDTTVKALFLPELMCTKGEAEHEDNCVDLIKLTAATPNSLPPLSPATPEPTLSEPPIQPKSHFQDNSEYYFQLFSYSNITFIQVYPTPQQWQIYNKQKTKKTPDGKTIKDWTRKEPTYFTITLRDDLAGTTPQYRYGYIIVEAYS